MNLPPYSNLLEKAHELGFHKAGVLVSAEFELEKERLKQWLFEGCHGEMHWMAENLDKRLSPESLMPGTKSILSVAMNYYPGEIPSRDGLKIARYAQGEDYHYLLKERLKLLLKWLKSFDSSIEGRPLVDSAPVMEKALAVKAGLGWQGKNSNLITRDMGSWLFLGELLLNFSFPDAPKPEPVNDLCGQCNRCMTACPTKALVKPYVVDATLCISYWTIEYKGEKIPQHIERSMEGWIFGCDICQAVCPWNLKFQKKTSEAAFAPMPCNIAPDPSEIESLTTDKFNTHYRRSPIKRAGLNGLKRNILTVS